RQGVHRARSPRHPARARVRPARRHPALRVAATTGLVARALRAASARGGDAVGEQTERTLMRRRYCRIERRLNLLLRHPLLHLARLLEVWDPIRVVTFESSAHAAMIGLAGADRKMASSSMRLIIDSWRTAGAG